MKLEQLSVFLENKPGTLAEVLEILENANIIIESVSISDDGDFGMLRIIFEDLEKGLKVLEEHNFLAKKNDIGIYKMPFNKSNYAKVFNKIKEADININYLNAFHYKEIEQTVFILKTDNMDKLEKVMEEYE